ncbi:septum formation family protein [Nakamurella deserti]|uniref:septum formation family protein n=1 Tax=Nakamurella deserti TaxID=2164074 RepID=UPI001300B6E0|nr:septum formation family protein [Nakamurella deserti]
MDRRAGGTLTLAVAVTVLVAVPRLLNPPLLDGVASTTPPPPAPAVGTCLQNSVTSSWGARGVLQPSDTVYVTCDRPHRAEIFRVVDPLPPPASAGTVFDLCGSVEEFSTYLGTAGGGWRPELQVRITASGPDARQVAAGQNWAACVLVDDVGPTLTAPLAGAAAAHTVPPQVGVCFDGGATDLAFRGTSPCDRPHSGELFGSRVVGTDADRDALTASCRDLAAADTGRPAVLTDPAFTVEAVVTDDRVREGDDVGDATATARCVVRALDGRQLTASLRGIGDGVVPWAG